MINNNVKLMNIFFNSLSSSKKAFKLLTGNLEENSNTKLLINTKNNTYIITFISLQNLSVTRENLNNKILDIKHFLGKGLKVYIAIEFRQVQRIILIEPLLVLRELERLKNNKEKHLSINIEFFVSKGILIKNKEFRNKLILELENILV